jgi:hypothetical protein
MADTIAAGADWLAGQLAQAAGKPVTYSRSGVAVTVTAVIGRSQFEAANQSGVVETWESRDFIIRAGALPFGEPLRHDRITEADGTGTVIYEVSAPRGVPLWHFGDAYRKTIRVHTTAAETQPAPLPSQLRVYWGASALASLTDQQIATQLSAEVVSSRAQSRTITASGAYVYFAIPSSLGVPTFTVGGFVTTAWQVVTRSIAFDAQPALQYAIHRSTYPVTGTISVVVS